MLISCTSGGANRVLAIGRPLADVLHILAFVFIFLTLAESFAANLNA